MKIIFLFSILSLCYSVKLITNICKKCKYYMEVPNQNPIYSKCLKFPTERENLVKYAVTGNKKDPSDYFHCETARGFEDMCGIDGKKYVKKIKI